MKWLILDMMGVIFKDFDDTRSFLIPYIRSFDESVTEEKIYERYDLLCVGKISSTCFWKAFGLPNKDYDYLIFNLRFDKVACTVARRIRDRYNYHLGIISTDASEWSKLLRIYYGIDDLFELAVISGDVGYRKPDLKLYRFFLEAANNNANRVVYVDDNLRYLEATKTLGWITVNFVKKDDPYPYKSDYSMYKWEEMESIIEEIEKGSYISQD